VPIVFVDLAGLIFTNLSDQDFFESSFSSTIASLDPLEGKPVARQLAVGFCLLNDHSS